MITQPTSAALARPPRKIDETTLGLTRSVRKTDDVECGQRTSAHGEDVGERVGGCDLAVRKRVVDNRCEKINGLHECAMAIQAIHAGVVERFRTDEHVRGLTKWEAAAKLVAGPVGSIWKLTRRRMKAKLACEFVHATCGSPPS